MFNSGKRKDANMPLTRLQVNNPLEEVAVQELEKTPNVVDKPPAKTKETTHVSSKSKKLELESSPGQLEILSVKQDNGQVMIEFRALNTSCSSTSGTGGVSDINKANQQKCTEIKVEDDIEFDATSISAQSIPEPQNNQTVPDVATTIKVEDQVDIKNEDEMEFCALSSTGQFILATNGEAYDNQPIPDKLAEIKVNEIEFGETSISVQTIDTTRAYFSCDICSKGYSSERTLTAHRTSHDNNRTVFTCNICSKEYLSLNSLAAHRTRHAKPRFHCSVCGVAQFNQSALARHMSTHYNGTNAYQCDISSKKYATKSSTVRHSKKRSTEPSTFRHQVSHSGDNFRCNFCGVVKSTQVELDKHMAYMDFMDYKSHTYGDYYHKVRRDQKNKSS